MGLYMVPVSAADLRVQQPLTEGCAIPEDLPGAELHGEGLPDRDKYIL